MTAMAIDRNVALTQRTLGEQPWIDDTAVVIDSRLGRYTEIGAHCKIQESRLDDYSYVSERSDVIYTEIGRFANIAAATRINPGQHPMHRASLHHFQYRSARYGLGPDDNSFFDWRRSSRVAIGHDTWIGHGAIVMGGVTVGTGSVIGAASVVTRDVPDYAIVAGSPARVIRYRFIPDVRAALARIAWWQWSHEQLAKRLADFRNLSVIEFCRKYDTNGTHPIFEET